MKNTYIHHIRKNNSTCLFRLIISIFKENLLMAGIMLLPLFTACNPSQMKEEDFGTAPTIGQVSINIGPGVDDYHIAITAKFSGSGIAKWDFGNGLSLSGSANFADTAYYPLPGTYKVKLTLYTRAGSISDSTMVTTTKTDYNHFNTPEYTYLSGGLNNATVGKTWVIDSLHSYHLGLGDPTHTWADWWHANALDKSGAGLYDDKVIFKLDGLQFIYINHGTTYAQNGVYTDLGGVATPALGDYIVQYTPPANLTWNIVTKKGSDNTIKNYIVFPNGGFMEYYAGPPFEYEITSISDDVLELRQQVSWTAWYYRFIREGYTY